MSYITSLPDKPESTPRSDVTIRDKTEVTEAFRSHATNQYMVAIVAPIGDREYDAWVMEGRPGTQRGNIIGVIASTIHISELLKQWEHTIRDLGAAPGNNERFLALAALRTTPKVEATLLDHPWMTSENLNRVAVGENDKAKSDALDAFMRRLQLKDRFAGPMAELASGRRDYREDKYEDPFGEQSEEFGGQWLAAFAPVAGTNWVAIVQERRATAIEPVQNVEAIFYRAGAIAIVVFGVLLAVLWYFLNRASSRT